MTISRIWDEIIDSYNNYMLIFIYYGITVYYINQYNKYQLNLSIKATHIMLDYINSHDIVLTKFEL